MSKRHKWYNEIVAWASGAEIESYAGLNDEIWDDEPYPDWNHTVLKFRIKPQPKEDIIKMTCCFCGQVIPYNTYHACTTEHNIKPQPKELPEIVKHWLNLGADMETIERIAAKVLSEGFSTQPKEPQYLYVFADLADWEATRTSVLNRKKDYETYIGKIKLEEEQ